jgi:sigma-B regulation protein RsbU (phosphoserine phosphatase)
MGDGGDFFTTQTLDWRERLAITVDVMRELSLTNDPQAMQQVYTRRMIELFPTTRQIGLSRRNLEYPNVRVTRFSAWDEEINPWREPHRLPLVQGGLFAELLYGDEPRILDVIDLEPGDPAGPYLADQQSLIAIPHYDSGDALNMVIATREEPYAFPPERFPDLVWMSNLFGRATQAVMLSKKLQAANESIAHEISMVARMQRSILPERLPKIPALDLAVSYQTTSSQAGGDYYDVLELPGGRWGVLIADVSGHGALAAVLMAITHSLTKTYNGPPAPPGLLLAHLNRHLCSHYTGAFGSFVTAFYAIFDPRRGTVAYANAGHVPPRLIRCHDGARQALEGTKRLPLGISDREEYPEETLTLVAGDQLIFCTDGVTEAANADREMFGAEGLDRALAPCPVGAQRMIDAVLASLREFTDGAPASDDRTILAVKFASV